MTSTATLTESLTYAQLVAKIQANELKKGASYTITDFATAHYMLDGEVDIIVGAKNIGVVEPLTVKAASSNSLFKEAFSSDYPQDTIYYDWNPENWKYDLAFAGFDEEVLPEWKGVIFFRHDTINDVSMGHDWRKVLNRRWKYNFPAYNSESTYAKGNKVQVDGVGAYVSLVDGNTGNALSSLDHWVSIIDYSITPYVCFEISNAQDTEDFIDVPCFYSQEVDAESQYNKEVKSVHLKPAKDDWTTYYWIATILQNNVFALAPDYGWYQVLGISAEVFCLNNTFLGTATENELGANFAYNVIGNAFQSNRTGPPFSVNFVGSYFTYNAVLGPFEANHIGDRFYNNIVGGSFSQNITGKEFRLNQFRNGGITGLAFGGASHVYQNYHCEIFKRQDGTVRLKYVDNNDADVVVAYNA